MREILPRRFAEETVRDEYSRVAWLYDLWSTLTESKAARQVLEYADLRSGEHVLEIAVGTGKVFSEIVRQNTNGMTQGLDISASMLDKAQQRMRGYAEDRYHLQLGSAYKLPFAANAFDLVVNNFMLDLLPEKDFAGVLAEFHRVLKPDGRIVLSTMTFGTRWYNRVWETIARHLPSLLTGCRPVEMTRSLAQAGFESIESVHLSQNTFPSEVIRARKVSNAG